MGCEDMAKRIGAEQVAYVAKLARLQLNDDEAAAFSEQLSAVLEYVQKLNELDTSDVEPLAHCLAVHNVFREDKPGRSLSTEQALANAPDQDGKFFKVPKILEDSSSGA